MVAVVIVVGTVATVVVLHTVSYCPQLVSYTINSHGVGSSGLVVRRCSSVYGDNIGLSVDSINLRAGVNSLCLCRERSVGEPNLGHYITSKLAYRSSSGDRGSLRSRVDVCCRSRCVNSRCGGAGGERKSLGRFGDRHNCSCRYRHCSSDGRSRQGVFFCLAKALAIAQTITHNGENSIIPLAGSASEGAAHCTGNAGTHGQCPAQTGH